MKPLSDQDLLLYFTKFKKEIKPKDHSYLFTTYANCFSGKEAVKALLSLFNGLSLEDAIQLGNQMIERKLFIHVTHESSQLLNKRYEFYRFTNFRRCSKRLSIMNVTQFTSSLDASYQKIIQDEYNNKGRVGDIRILLDDVYLSSQNCQSTNAVSTNVVAPSNSGLLSRSSSFFSSSCVQSLMNDDIAVINNQTNETDSSSPDQQNGSSISLFGKKISVPLKIRKNSQPSQPSHQNSPPMSNSFDNPNFLKKSPRGNNSPFTGFSSELSQHHKSSSAEDLYGRKVRLNEYVDASSLGVGSPLKTVATSSIEDWSPLQDSPSPQSSSNEAISSSPRRAGMLVRTFSQDLELKRNLEDMDLDFDKFANIDDVLKHPKACAILTKFAIDEYAEESIYFWKDLKAYKKESRIDCKLDLAIKIYDTYVNPDGSLALNITKKQIVECRKKYLNADDDCFDDIQKEVKIILNDLLDRLRLGIQQQKTSQINMMNSKASLVPSSTSNLKMSRSDEGLAFVQ